MIVEAALLASVAIHARGRAAVAGSLRAERAEHYDRRDRAHHVRVARAKWLEAHEASAFPCGVVRPVPPRPDREAPAWPFPDEVAVSAAVSPEAITFLVEPPEGSISDDPIEAGTVPLAAVTGITVVRDGGDVARPAAESFEDEPECALVVRWAGGEQRLIFRSAWLAWRCADRFDEATG